MSTDNQLKQDVLAELAWEPGVNSAHIGVTTNSGVVTLTGHVENFMEKHAAEMAARRVGGVKAVAEEIEVLLPLLRIERSDEEIAAAAVGRLAWDVSIPQDAVMVKVENGWVTLSGSVDWNYQKDAAARDIYPLFGIVGVSNLITIKAIEPRGNAQSISDDITQALHRSWFFDPEAITVTADGGKVRLTGTARSWHERELAASTAWAAPGAIAVENDIIVR